MRRLDVSIAAGAEGQDSHMPSLAAEDLIMAVLKASSRRVEVINRTTGNVDQVYFDE